MEKKAQLKIKQMTFMLLAVVLFFILVGLFFASFALSRLQKQATQLNKEEALSLALRMAGSPEFSCGSYCVDTDKVMALKGIEAYAGFFQVESIEVRKLAGERECTINVYPDCDVLVVVKKPAEDIRYIRSFVSLCRKEVENGYAYDRCEPGEILIGYT